MIQPCTYNEPDFRSMISSAMSSGYIEYSEGLKMLSLLNLFPHDFYMNSEYSGTGSKTIIEYGVKLRTLANE